MIQAPYERCLHSIQPVLLCLYTLPPRLYVQVLAATPALPTTESEGGNSETDRDRSVIERDRSVMELCDVLFTAHLHGWQLICYHGIAQHVPFMRAREQLPSFALANLHMRNSLTAQRDVT